MKPEDLRTTDDLAVDVEAYPADLPLENRALPLVYAYKPGQTDDGVTLSVHVREAEALTQKALDWAVPGHVEAKVEHYLRALPKELRRAFMPLAETAKSVAAQLVQRDRLTGRREGFLEALAALLTERSRIGIDPSLWVGKPLPDHLRVRVCVLDDHGDEICSSRDLGELQAALAAKHRELSVKVASEDPAGWRRARQQWEKSDQMSWNFGDIPSSVPVSDQAGVTVQAFPGLKSGAEGVALRLFKTADEAHVSTRHGLERLIELQLRYELAWLQKDLRKLRELGTLTTLIGPLETLQDDAYFLIRRWVCQREVVPLTAARFNAVVETAKADVRRSITRLQEILRPTLELRQALAVHPQPYAGMEKDLAMFMPPRFLRTIPFEQFEHYPRYLKARWLRAERWRQNPAKDAERAKQLEPYVAAWVSGKEGAKRGESKNDDFDSQHERAERFRWLIEEFRVSLFAQELGTAEPVSAVKLDRALAEWRSGVSLPPAGEMPNPRTAPDPKLADPGPSAPPLIMPIPAEKKSGKLKSLGALDSLFRK
jgi:ATP-dependent helicase HrpA